MSSTIIIDKIPFLADGKSIEKININPIFFKSFTRIAQEVADRSTPEKFNIMNRRARLIHQTELVTSAGDILKFNEMSLTQLPIVYAKQLDKLLNDGQGDAGEIVNDGDGISSSVIYKLGTPIKMNANAEGLTIYELEFMASTFGQIEEAMAESNSAAQAVKLLETIAKPVAIDIPMQALPSWAVDQITMGDGFVIGDKIVPRFLD